MAGNLNSTLIYLITTVLINCQNHKDDCAKFCGILRKARLYKYSCIYHMTPCYRGCMQAWQLKGPGFKSTYAQKFSVNIYSIEYVTRCVILSPHYLLCLHISAPHISGGPLLTTLSGLSYEKNRSKSRG